MESYAIIVTVIALGAGATACIVKRWFNSCGEERSEYEAVVQRPGKGTWFLGGESRDGVIRDASQALNEARATTPRDYSGCLPKR